MSTNNSKQLLDFNLNNNNMYLSEMVLFLSLFLSPKISILSPSFICSLESSPAGHWLRTIYCNSLQRLWSSKYTTSKYRRSTSLYEFVAVTPSQKITKIKSKTINVCHLLANYNKGYQFNRSPVEWGNFFWRSSSSASLGS